MARAVIALSKPRLWAGPRAPQHHFIEFSQAPWVDWCSTCITDEEAGFARAHLPEVLAPLWVHTLHLECLALVGPALVPCPLALGSRASGHLSFPICEMGSVRMRNQDPGRPGDCAPLKRQRGVPLVVQWLELGASAAGARVQSVVRELRSCKPRGTAIKKKKRTKDPHTQRCGRLTSRKQRKKPRVWILGEILAPTYKYITGMWCTHLQILHVYSWHFNMYS